MTSFAEDGLGDGTVVVEEDLVDDAEEALLGTRPDTALLQTERLERIELSGRWSLGQRRARSRLARNRRLHDGSVLRWSLKCTFNPALSICLWALQVMPCGLQLAAGGLA